MHRHNIERKLDESRRASAKPDSPQNLKAIIRTMRVRDRLLTQQLAAVCNALADALGMPADQLDPNRLPEYVKQLTDMVDVERENSADLAFSLAQARGEA